MDVSGLRYCNTPCTLVGSSIFNWHICSESQVPVDTNQSRVLTQKLLHLLLETWYKYIDWSTTLQRSQHSNLCNEKQGKSKLRKLQLNLRPRPICKVTFKFSHLSGMFLSVESSQLMNQPLTCLKYAHMSESGIFPQIFSSNTRNSLFIRTSICQRSGTFRESRTSSLSLGHVVCVCWSFLGYTNYMQILGQDHVRISCDIFGSMKRLKSW